ncbi:MAG: hypothetical protein SGILL_000691 [Bacillariaceae sp.]
MNYLEYVLREDTNEDDSILDIFHDDSDEEDDVPDTITETDIVHTDDVKEDTRTRDMDNGPQKRKAALDDLKRCAWRDAIFVSFETDWQIIVPYLLTTCVLLAVVFMGKEMD